MNTPRALLLFLLMGASLSLVAAISAEDTAADVISRYVVRQTGWKRGGFRIEKGSASHGITRYEVIYIPEEKAPLTSTGGGKSFAVEYDSHKHEVVREWHYQ